jgi:hypothetical protein
MNYFFHDNGNLSSSVTVLSLLKGTGIVSEFSKGNGYHPSPEALGHRQVQAFFSHVKSSKGKDGIYVKQSNTLHKFSELSTETRKSGLYGKSHM